MVNAILGTQYDLTQQLNEIKRQLRQLATQPVLLHASTGQDAGTPGLSTDINGLHLHNASGVEVARLETSDGALVMFDSTGAEIARYGILTHTAAGSYGAEVLVGGTWVQLGAQTTTWASVSGKPAAFPPSAHTHVGADITSGTVPQADGSQYGWTNTVAGTTQYALWVGNDGGFHFGRNVSSIRYKQDVRSHYTDPANVLALTPVLYDKIGGNKDEYGLIAEQVAEHCPELVQWFEGQIDGVRYDLLAVQLLNVVRDQESRLRVLEGRAPLPAQTATANTPAPGAPAPQPAALPYTIQPQ
ncbi:tail fiber domain-containing protein [Pseudarthrobacter albicanus]|uniref:tail fiber domain-containing protein n=1 Tax=Pseudarthrobacter albicanus TaxID=2823873 RepID=UPI001BAA9DA4|nr:tail fiber domain-containing protein [Pseudarthrobacter albicanus]